MIYSDLINISVGYSDRWEIPASMYLKYLLSYIFLGKKEHWQSLRRSCSLIKKRNVTVMPCA